MEVNKVFVGRCRNIKICTKLTKTQPNEKICKILGGGVNICLELLYAMMKRYLEMT